MHCVNLIYMYIFHIKLFKYKTIYIVLNQLTNSIDSQITQIFKLRNHIKKLKVKITFYNL